MSAMQRGCYGGGANTRRNPDRSVRPRRKSPSRALTMAFSDPPNSSKVLAIQYT